VVDLGESTTFNKIELDSGVNEGDYPKGYEVYVSSNGSSWGSAIASGAGIGKSVQSSFPTQNARYIKVVLTEADSNNWWSINGFRVYNQSPDLIDRSNWTVTAYTSGGGTSASSMIDGNLSTRWANGEAQEDGQWVKVDMDDIYPICAVAVNAGGFTGDYPRGYTIEISTDGTNWHTAAEGAIPSQDNLISFPFTYARFIKITQTGTASSNWWSIAEVNVLTESYFSDLTSISHSGWSATASHTESGGSAANAIDGQLQEPRDEPYNWGSVDDTASRWSSGKAQEGNEWFQVDMGSSQTFSAVEVNCGPYTNDYASHYILYVSSDGTNWTPIATGDGYGPVMRIEFTEVTARYININQTGTASNKWWTIAEFNVLY